VRSRMTFGCEMSWLMSYRLEHFHELPELSREKPTCGFSSGSREKRIGLNNLREN
jgi:hypothetical protein